MTNMKNMKLVFFFALCLATVAYAQYNPVAYAQYNPELYNATEFAPLYTKVTGQYYAWDSSCSTVREKFSYPVGVCKSYQIWDCSWDGKSVMISTFRDDLCEGVIKSQVIDRTGGCVENKPAINDYIWLQCN